MLAASTVVLVISILF